MDLDRTTDGETARAAPTSPLLEGLNPPQSEAVTHGDGPLLILAGPGSGKTRVITRRIAWLIRERGVPPWGVLAITFTNKAAGEMRDRVERLLPAQALWISTFHSMCARILRRDIQALEGHTRDFSIYDTHDRNELIKKILKDANWDPARFKPAMVGAWISAGKNRGFAAGSAEAEIAPGEDGIEHEVLVQVRRRYEEAMRRADALDFDDLLLKVLELFDKRPDVRDAYARRFVHVLVDEYQDTNRAQYLLTRHLSSVHGNLTVCGDPDQSIYAWRGADIGNILDFEADFGRAHVVRLEQNYRSTGNILAAAQAVIVRNRSRKEKSIWTAAGPGERIVALRCADENDEAREIALQIRSLLTSGRKPGDVAVFYRVNFMQRALESALRLSGIPYRIVGGVEFYARREIRDLVSYLKLAVNPSDEIAFRRAVGAPQRGIGEKSVEAIVRWAQDRRVPVLRALRSSEALALVKGRARAALEAFANLMETLHLLADAPAAAALEAVVAGIDYPKWIASLDDESGVDREANVEELRAHAAEYDRMTTAADTVPGTLPHDSQTNRGQASQAPMGTVPGTGGLRGFLQDIALVSDVDSMEEGVERVTLMTLHSAKGLEFPCVFVAGVEEELLPHVRALTEARGDDPDAGVEEERRLFYVGVTRAKERLFLMHARTRLHFGQESLRSPSRFLAEIPPSLIEGDGPEAEEDDAPSAFEPAPVSIGIRVGDRVEHDHFGRGTVERLQGSGVNTRATVRFPRHGEKQLLLAYARLRVIGEGAR